MNRSSSSNTQKKKWSQVAGKMELKKNKKKQSFRNPLQEANNIKDSNNNSSSCSGSGSLSSSVSIEAPKGCLRFFLSHSSSSKSPFCNCRPAKAPAKTPKSAPISRPSKSLPKSNTLVKQNNFPKRAVSETPISQKLEKVQKWQFVKKPSSKIGQKNSNDSSFLDSNGSPVKRLASGSQGSLRQQDEVQCTPVSKLATGSGLDCIGVVDGHNVFDDEKSKGSDGNTTTPPIQASLSPEIQCGSDVVSTKATTSACYGAGHVISGITDKRKCRPRGILAVGDYGGTSSLGKLKALDNFDDFDIEDSDVGIVNNSRVSMVPLPAEASMHWLLSPCHEENESEENSKIRSCQLPKLVGPNSKTLNSPSSPLSGPAFSLDLCKVSTHRSGTTDGSNSMSGRKYLLSPSEVPHFSLCLDSLCENVVVSSSPNVKPCYGAGSLKEERKNRYDFGGGNSPFSVDTLGSENVIQTPQSESSSERPGVFSCLSANDHRKHDIDFELSTAAEDVQRASLSLKSHISIWDQTNSSFQFDHLPSPSSSVDLSQFQKVLGGQALWTSDSTLENFSQSQMRISWREGLASRIFEMDELDSCRCLSEEEEDFKINSNDQLKSFQNPEINIDMVNDLSLNDAFGSAEFVDSELTTERKCKERLPSVLTYSCAESISTDGGGLVSSEESNWSLCYKNSLFET
ncbi:hypothetical protein SLE2022_073170 [Rubroshorea leprosula]